MTTTIVIDAIIVTIGAIALPMNLLRFTGVGNTDAMIIASTTATNVTNT